MSRPAAPASRAARRALAVTAALCLAAAGLAACARRAMPEHSVAPLAVAPPAPPAPLARGLFAADLVVAQQHALGLDPAQRAALARELDAARAELLPLDAALRTERDALAVVLGASRIDEADALSRAARVTELEGRVKVAHLRLLVRIKNLLTVAQQAMLTQLERAVDASVVGRDGGAASEQTPR